VVVGGFLVAVAAVVVFAAAVAGASSDHGRPWVVAARPLSAGTVLGPDDLGTSAMRLSGPAGRMAFRTSGELLGRSLAVSVRPGELIQSTMLAPAGSLPPLRPVSVAVDPVSLADLTPGQPVDVLDVAGSGSGASPGSVSVVVRGATLMTVGRASSDVLSPGNSGQVTVGVATLAEVEAVVAAAHSGTVVLVAAEHSDGIGPGSSGPGQ
jgi:Flp pilus assembly protein CpaB